jgi:hypothetical protein
LAGATSIFYARIGSDELDCALIAEGLGPGDTIFQPVKLEQWRLEQGAEGLNQQTLEIRLQDHLQRLRQSLIGRCRRFVARHARSKRVGPVLWIEAQCQSLQLDVSAFQAGTVRYSASFPSSGSVRLWQQIGQECPGTPHAALADGRLGELALRRQDVKEADLRLQAAAKGLEGLLAAQRRAVMLEPETGLFQPAEAVPSLGYYAETLLRIRRLIWLMERNNVLNDPTDGEALAAMLNENPYEPQYEERLGRLAGRYEKTALGDNLKLAVAMATADPYGQAEMLIWLAEDERTDAAVEANYQLGMLVMQTARAHALRLIPKLKKPQDYFQIVIAAPPNPWTQLAREHLSRLEETPQEKPLALEADRQGK